MQYVASQGTEQEVDSNIVCNHLFLHRPESGPRKVAWTPSHSASLGSLTLRARNLPAWPVPGPASLQAAWLVE